MFNFFAKDKSKSVAKDRLKFVLVHDRAVISPQTLEELKKEIIGVISKYIDIDTESLNLELSQTSEEVQIGRDVALIANIPIKIKPLK